MREIGIDELKQIQLDILLKVHEFCRDNGIRYFIVYGTLIGALRHKGYIPWDDDIDIAMPRPDYDRLIHSFSGAYPELEVAAPELDYRHYVLYANVMDNRTVLIEGDSQKDSIKLGVKIDVFPIDGVPSDAKQYAALKRKAALYRDILFFKHYDFGKVLRHKNFKDIKGIVKYWFLDNVRAGFPSRKKIMDFACSIPERYPYETSEMADKITTPSIPMTVCPKDVFEHYIDIEFEGHTVRTIRDYDVYMSKVYGDYKSLPPEEQRVMHHGFTAYWKD